MSLSRLAHPLAVGRGLLNNGLRIGWVDAELVADVQGPPLGTDVVLNVDPGTQSARAPWGSV